jgi:hypothetical protein
MTQAVYGNQSTDCDPLSAPVLDPATPASNQIALSWSTVTGAEGYNVYYDQAGKAQLVADAGATSTYTDTGLTNGNEYCYKVTAYYTCSSELATDPRTVVESAFSDVECATPRATGQDTLADVDSESFQTGYYETTGKGKTQTTVFILVPSADKPTFAAGDGVVIRAYVRDDSSNYVSNASVDIAITGPETVSLTAGPSDNTGLAEATWNTSAPNRKGTGGTTPGSYTATAANVTGGGIVYSAELIPEAASATFDIQ